MLFAYTTTTWCGCIIFLLIGHSTDIDSFIPGMQVLFSLAECLLILLDHCGNRIFALGWMAPSRGLFTDSWWALVCILSENSTDANIFWTISIDDLIRLLLCWCAAFLHKVTFDGRSASSGFRSFRSIIVSLFASAAIIIVVWRLLHSELHVGWLINCSQNLIMVLFEQVLSVHHHFTPRLWCVRLSNHILSRGSFASRFLSTTVLASCACRFQATHRCNILTLLVVMMMVIIWCSSLLNDCVGRKWLFCLLDDHLLLLLE